MENLKADDILVASWGYDQTNTSFYEVIKCTEKTVWLKAINKTVTYADKACTRVAIPNVHDFVNEEIIRRKITKGDGKSFVMITSYKMAEKYNENKIYVETY